MKSLTKKLAIKLTKKNQTLALAESCTGGMISASITSIAGASKFFQGAIVSYANHIKHDLLRVPSGVLNKWGAVSQPTARYMALGARKALRADWAISVTGIAGPSGGTKEKPVGLVYYAVAGPKVVVVEYQIFEGNRKKIQEQACEAAISLLLKQI